MKSLFAARQRYWRGDMTKVEFNQLCAREIFGKWIPRAQATPHHWRWLCELAAYMELKFHGMD